MVLHGGPLIVVVVIGYYGAAELQKLVGLV
jgi:hypothetical protein